MRKTRIGSSAAYITIRTLWIAAAVVWLLVTIRAVLGEEPTATIEGPTQARAGALAVLDGTQSEGEAVDWEIRPTPDSDCFLKADDGRTLILSSPTARAYTVVLWSSIGDQWAAATHRVVFTGGVQPGPNPGPDPIPPTPEDGYDLIVIVHESSETTADQRRTMDAVGAKLTAMRDADETEAGWRILDQDAETGEGATPSWAAPFLTAAEGKPLPQVVCARGDGQVFVAAESFDLPADEAEAIRQIEARAKGAE